VSAENSQEKSAVSQPPPRELSLRDVRDLALAVIEGAVAAESLAKELRRTPDRSRHFQEIAERLRGVLGRASIRTALADDSVDSVALPRAVAMLPRNSVRISNGPEGRPSSRSDVTISEIPSEAPKGSPQLDRIEAILQRLPGPGAIEALSAKLARLEQLTGRAVEGERQTVRSPEEVLALAGRIIDRLRREPSVFVRIEPPEK
jgi:hypothetical protein